MIALMTWLLGMGPWYVVIQVFLSRQKYLVDHKKQYFQMEIRYELGYLKSSNLWYSRGQLVHPGVPGPIGRPGRPDSPLAEPGPVSEPESEPVNTKCY